MQARRFLLPAILASGMALSLPCVASAQQGLEWLIGPTLGQLKPTLAFESTLYPDRPVTGQAADMGMSQHRARLLAPIVQNDRFEWAALGGVMALSTDTDAILPDTKQAFPDRLWDVEFGTAARRKLENGWIVGGDLTLASPSDRPFGSIREMSVTADALLRVPWRDSLGWIFLLNYSNLREFLPDVPLPGVALAYAPGPHFQLLAGMPLLVRWAPTEDLELSASYVVLRTVRTRVSYRMLRRLSIYAGFDWDSQRFLRHDRDDADARLFYYEKRAGGGIRWDVTAGVYLDAGGGYAFDRFWFEGKKYSDRNNNRIDLADGPFALLRVGVRF